VRGITPTFLVTTEEVRENEGVANHFDLRGAIFSDHFRTRGQPWIGDIALPAEMKILSFSSP
jgi:hypothetical protein